MVRCTRLTSAALGLAAILLGSYGWADPPRVEVGGTQTTTVVGRFPSLARLLRDVCQRANVELRAFDAVDRPVTVDQLARPLPEVIAHLLSEENYLLGVRGPDVPDRPPEIAWLRVTGSRESHAEAMLSGLSVPSQFGSRSFEEESPSETRRAEHSVAARLLGDQRLRSQLLAMDPAELAESLRQYPHIEDLLGDMRAGQEPEVREKLDAVIRRLRTDARADGRRPPRSR